MKFLFLTIKLNKGQYDYITKNNREIENSYQ